MNKLHALIDFSAQDDLPAIRLAFGAPVRELLAWRAGEGAGWLDEVDALAARGFWCAGYLRYEAAAAFEPRAALHPADGPLAYFSVHRESMEPPALSAEAAEPIHWKWPLDRCGFDAGFAAIHRAIEAGETYQVNYTSTLEARYSGDAFDLFCSLRRAQPHCQAAYMRNQAETLLSVSPELFFDKDGDRLQCRPMKGTAPRGETAERDAARAAELRNSPKERAENVMIVDLMRSDMGRVAEPGSVQVTRLFDCRPLPTVWQMTSTIVARTRPGTSLKDLFGALFPCGSVTGAPKLRAMHWIKELEPAARGIYCGAIGVVQPGGRARFNVPIRTVVLRGDRATCGVGSGITASATAEGEWAEWAHKTRFLEQAVRERVAGATRTPSPAAT
jgi:para-aminobenzoate synthetase/4-amino-4-deoxychorismate lyase